MCMTNAKVNDVRAAKEEVLRHVPAHSILIMDRGYCDFGLFRDLDAKGVIFVTRMKTNQKFSRSGDGKIGNNYGDYEITFTSQTAVKKLGEGSWDAARKVCGIKTNYRIPPNKRKIKRVPLVPVEA